MRFLVYLAVLSPLIQINYWLRRLKLRKDKWHWADRLASKWGYLGPWDFK